MTSPLRSLLPFLTALLLIALSGSALAASPRFAAHRASPRLEPVTVTITTTGGIVWGTVWASYTYRHRTTRLSCAAASCMLHVPQGVTLRLSQVPRNSMTWPFRDWQVGARQRMQAMRAPSIALKVTGSTSVTAVYVLAQSQSSSGSGGSYWP